MKEEEIGEVVIIGAGPVGNFCATICAELGIKASIYQKRDAYLREQNIRIEPGFFLRTSELIGDLCLNKSNCFKFIEEQLQVTGHKIQLKKLESILKQNAQHLGITFYQKQIQSFQQIQTIHQRNNPLILDCTGRRSTLRTNMFGADHENMEIKKLAEAMYINFDAQITTSNSYELLYSVLKNIPSLKLGQIVLSKASSFDNHVHVTIPLFISQDLGNIFDSCFPNINQSPIKPFSQEYLKMPIPDEIQIVMSSIFCSLVMHNWKVNWSDVELKKLTITCGYAKSRSQNRYVCLGDSAAHFAYYRSLNFGLETALDFFKVLSSYPHLLYQKKRKVNEALMLSRFRNGNIFFNPITLIEGPSMNSYFIKTHVLAYNIFYYIPSQQKSSFIDLKPYCSERIADIKIHQFKQKIQGTKWQEYLAKFEEKRKVKLKQQTKSNTLKSSYVQLASYLIWANRLSPIKISQTISYLKNGYYLTKDDFLYFCRILKSFKLCLADSEELAHQLQIEIADLESTYQNSYQSKSVNIWNIIYQLKEAAKETNFNWIIFTRILNNSDLDSQYTNKSALLLIKCLQMISDIYRQNQAKCRSVRNQGFLELLPRKKNKKLHMTITQ